MPTIRQYRTKAHKNYGINVREPYPGELAYFKANPGVAGMAGEDYNVVLNPYSKLSEKEKHSVVDNETMRAFMRKFRIQPKYGLTPDQNEYYQQYSPNINDAKETIAARVASGDPTALDYTDEQKEFSSNVWRMMTEGKLNTEE